MRVLVISSCLVWWFLGGVGAAAGEHFSYNAQGKCDPFVPLVRNGQLVPCRPQPPRPTLTLQGIVWDPAGESFALINDREVQIGNTVGDYQVAEIRHDAVVLVQEGTALTLTMSLEGRANGTTR